MQIFGSSVKKNLVRQTHKHLMFSMVFTYASKKNAQNQFFRKELSENLEKHFRNKLLKKCEKTIEYNAISGSFEIFFELEI